MKSHPPYTVIESWLYQVEEWKIEAEVLKEQLLNIKGLTQRYELVPIYGKGHKNEMILNQVIQRLEAKEKVLPVLETRIRLLDMAKMALSPDEKTFVELKYKKKVANFLIMDQLEWSHRTFYLRRKQILSKLYQMLGGEDVLLWFSSPETEDLL